MIFVSKSSFLLRIFFLYHRAILHLVYHDVLFSLIAMFWDTPILICIALVYSLHCLTSPECDSVFPLFITLHFSVFLVSASLWLYALSSTLPWALLFDSCGIWLGIVPTTVPLLLLQDLLSLSHVLLGWDIPPSSPCTFYQDLTFWILFLSCIETLYLSWLLKT